MIRVLLVDDDVLVLQGLQMRLALESDIVVVGEASDGVTAIKHVKAFGPDVVVTDIDMPKMDGITLIEWLSEVAPCVATVVLTVYDHQEVRVRARAAGAQAFVCKQEDVEHLIDAIHSVALSGATGNQEQ